MLKKCSSGFITAAITWVLVLFPLSIQAAQYKVLVVMSYEETYPWDVDIKEGIQSVLADSSEVHYFYMDTKINLEGGPSKAVEAYRLYTEFQPDGVITADDNAQSMFVVPYLKDKVDTPVMFCGVNAEPESYGYPASNVSGILERYHINQSIALVQQLVPSVKNISFLLKNSPAGKAIITQIEGEKEKYLAQSVAIKEPNTLDEALAMASELKEQSDCLFMTVWQGISDAQGKPLTDKEVIPILTSVFGKPTIGAVEFQVQSGALCSVVQTGQEQGRTAAKMLLQAMQGTPISELPITRNRQGKRVINVTTMKQLGIKPRADVLAGAKLVKTEQ